MKIFHCFFQLIIIALISEYVRANCSEGYICEICSNDKSKCELCNKGYYLLSGECYSCSSECSMCLKSNACLRCKDGYYLYQWSCVLCNSPCKTCLSSSHCSSCIDGYYLSGSSCSPCGSPCKTCGSSSSHC